MSMTYRIDQLIEEVQERILLGLGTLSERAFNMLCYGLVDPAKYALVTVCLLGIHQAIEFHAFLSDETSALEQSARSLRGYRSGRGYNPAGFEETQLDSSLETDDTTRGQAALATINSIAVESGVHIDAVITGGACRRKDSSSRSRIQISFRAGFGQIRLLYDRIVEKSENFAVESLVVERANLSDDVSTLTGSICIEIVTKSSASSAKLSATNLSVKQSL